MEISAQYNPKGIEEKWYKFWLKNNYFSGEKNSKKKSYTIVMPPPNVTASLHMGHALNNTIQDIIIRYKRMSNFNCLWLPGTDHAGIATQNVVEKMLLKKGIKRDNLGREKFLARVWEWKRNYGGRIAEQLKRLGASCDWSRQRFTMDEGLSSAVTKAFTQLYKKNLIYQGNYIINWCPRCGTALSNEEAEHREEEGFLYYIKYPFAAGNDYLTVATTRPETMFGDTAVAVNPGDKRYRDFVGRQLVLPLTRRKIPVIAHHLVDPDFGTGAVKVTPAHDPNDFLIGRDKKLDSIIVIDTRGKMNQEAGKFAGLDRFECREKILEELKKLHLFVKKEPHHYSVAHCYRCGTVIEPYLSRQWFVRMKPLAEKALKEAKKGKPKFYPARWGKVYLDWLQNVQDWCISRQIWWGHRIPVYYCQKGDIIVAREKPEKCPVCGSKEIHQETDVLDTWFSSWLWPFSSLGWPEETKDLKNFYPTDTLVTAPDIIFFWVVRMVMAGMEFEQKIPFSNVYIHGVVRDEQGKKMSKSLGNTVDPLKIIDDVGADALRYSIILITATGQDLFLGKDTFKLGRNFCNKIWNASRFILMNLEEGKLKTQNSKLKINDLSLPQRWILTELNLVIERVTKSLDSFRFNEAAHSLYEFFWHQFCDWYLEIAKVDLKTQNSKLKTQNLGILSYLLDNSLRLLHPFIPFITEEIWQKMGHRQSIMVSQWPKSDKKLIAKSSLPQMETLINLVVAIRDLRARFHLKPSQDITIILVTKKEEKKIIAENVLYLKSLCNLKELEIKKSSPGKKFQARSLIKGIEIILPLTGVIDLEVEKERISREIEKIEREMGFVESKLKNEGFLKNAPETVVSKEQEKEKNLGEKLKKMRETIEFMH